MNWDKLVEFTSRLGFPVAVAAYLLWRWDGLMIQLITNQTMMLELLKRHMGQ
jgi:hypothetical protein